MMKLFYSLLLAGASLAASSCSDDNEPNITPEAPFQLPEKAYVLAEQSRSAIVVMDAETCRNVWSWDPVSAGLPVGQQSWFINPSEAKPVFNRRYILMTASGGAVALIRLADHKLMFYAQVGNNPHSAEILPDGNLVVACSTGNELCTLVTDTVKVLGTVANRISLGNAHNAVWDKQRNRLYATATIKEGVTALFSYAYNYDKNNPKLTNQQRIYTFESDNGGHDLYPVYGEANQLWLTTEQHVWKYNVATNQATVAYDFTGIKSISNSPDGVVMLCPTEEWWAEGLMNDCEETLFQLRAAKIYKGRWMRDNTFSYPETHDLTLGNNLN